MLSIVIPVFNEEESLPLFYRELLQELRKLNKAYEIIFVDDGSNDKSLEILKDIASKDKNVSVLSFRKHAGKAEALTFGFQKAEGEYVITLDADLEDRPQEIGNLLDKIKEGYDLVSGWRKDRKHSLIMTIPSKLFNSISGAFWGLKLHDYNCGLKVYRKEVVKNLHLYGGLYRFIPLIAHQLGFRISEIPVVHQKRRYGKSKYGTGLSKIFKNLPDMFTMLFLTKYGKKPLHFFGLIGGIFTFIGIAIIGYLTFIHYVFNESVGRRPLLFMGMLFVISGFQVFFTGFLADLILNVVSKNQNGENNRSLLKYSSKKLQNYP